jgi:hypothetical protein
MKMINLRPLRFWAAITMLALALQLFGRQHGARTQEKRWYKGNTHTHTVNSDGDSTPDEVVRWYREHGYNGRWGKILKEVTTNPAVYTLNGDEFYVRAKVIESNGKAAWTQPVFLKD